MVLHESDNLYPAWERCDLHHDVSHLVGAFARRFLAPQFSYVPESCGPIGEVIFVFGVAGYSCICLMAVSAEKLDFPSESFDVITACQCFWYFDHDKVAPEFHRILKKDGKIVILFMAWLPFEDLVHKYSPDWTGGGETKHPIYIPDVMFDYFELEDHEEYDLMVPFTKESWHGRMFVCRGVGASLSPEELAKWDEEHRAMLEYYPDSFEIKHYAAIAVLKKRSE